MKLSRADEIRRSEKFKFFFKKTKSFKSSYNFVEWMQKTLEKELEEKRIPLLWHILMSHNQLQIAMAQEHIKFSSFQFDYGEEVSFYCFALLKR